MTVFGRGDETIFGAVIADSLHRARPARFSGFDLSLTSRAGSGAAERHPSLLPISVPGPADARVFFDGDHVVPLAEERRSKRYGSAKTIVGQGGATC